MREHARKGKREGLGGRERRTVCAMLGTFSLKSFTGALHSTCSITTVMQHRDTLFILITFRAHDVILGVDTFFVSAGSSDLLSCECMYIDIVM